MKIKVNFVNCTKKLSQFISVVQKQSFAMESSYLYADTMHSDEYSAFEDLAIDSPPEESTSTTEIAAETDNNGKFETKDVQENTNAKEFV